MKATRPGALRGRVVGEADREHLPGHRQKPGEQDRDPHVRASRSARSRAAAPCCRAPSAAQPSRPTLLPAYQLKRIAGINRPSVYGTACKMIDVTEDGNWRMLVPRSPCNKRHPEVVVLLPQRQIEIEGPHVVVIDVGRDLRILDLQPPHQRQHRIPRHQMRDRPVDRHRHHERQRVDEQLPQEVTSHRVSSLTPPVSSHRPSPHLLPRGGAVVDHGRLASVDVLAPYFFLRCVNMSMPVICR